jgi:hypothetical protein
MSAVAATILAHLHAVDAERRQRAAEPGLVAKATALKDFQQRRFSHTYPDLLASSRYGAAARFVLDELYGPRDYTLRDAQFAKVVPALVRLFPHEIVETVMHLAQLHALSEALDTAMARHLGAARPTPEDYVRAWQRVGRPEDRRAQIALTLDVAGRLDRLTRKALLRTSLHLMRKPARAAGLGELQLFLETGFDTFRAMNGAQEFLAIVAAREEELAAALFAADLRDPDGASRARALAALPAA